MIDLSNHQAARTSIDKFFWSEQEYLIFASRGWQLSSREEGTGLLPSASEDKEHLCSLSFIFF